MTYGNRAVCGVLCGVGQSGGMSQPGQCWIVRMVRIERKFLVIASSASPTFQHLRISRKFSCNELKTPGSVKKRSRDGVLIEADNKGIWWRKHLFSLGNTTLVEPLSSDTLPILPWIKLKRCCGGLLKNWLDLNWLFDGSLPSWWTCLVWSIWSNVQQGRLSLLSLAPCDPDNIWKQCYEAERSCSVTNINICFVFYHLCVCFIFLTGMRACWEKVDFSFLCDCDCFCICIKQLWFVSAMLYHLYILESGWR